jgi:antitoxin PrlF
MKYSSSISSKGQVTVPQEIRNRLGLSAGDRVEFVIENGQTAIRPFRGEANPFEKYKGALRTFPGGEKEIQSWLREMMTSLTFSQPNPVIPARKNENGS